MFITIDGPDGAGKTTLVNNVVKELNEKYHLPTIYTCEPTNGPLGLRIRELTKTEGSKEEILELFLADRKDHIENFIIPELQKGNIVISDRYKYSTVCYQHLQGFDIDLLVKKNKFLVPDIAFIINTEYDILKKRLREKNIAREIFEIDDYLRKSIDLYKKMRGFFPDENFIFVDANRSREDLVEIIVSHILQKKSSRLFFNQGA